MINYRIIRCTGQIGYKVDVTNASSGLRIIGVFPSEADAMHWIATDQDSTVIERQDRAGIA